MLYRMLENSLKKFGSQKIFFSGKKVSYQCLLQESRSIAAELKGQKYGIYCKDKYLCILAILACLQKGKTIVLLCPEYGKSFNQTIIERAGVQNFITDNGDGKWKVLTKCFENEEELEDVAFIIHTSGSTGSAKGVLLTQQNIYENIRSTLKYYPINQTSTALLYRPIYHATTVFGELFTTIAAGAELYVEPSSMPFPYLARILKKYEVTHLAGTPTFFIELLKSEHEKEYFGSINVISVGGECMTENAAEIMKKGFSNADIFHCYGMTEASPRVLYLPPQYFGKKYQCVGKSLDGVSVRLGGEEGYVSRQAGREFIGELYVCGANIMKGYYKDKAATEKVLKDGWYATGDCGYRDENGFYYIIGRKDQLYIRAGVNIWLKDVEEAIMRHPLVKEVYVYAEQKEKLYLTAQVDGEYLKHQELMKWCVQNLPMPYIPDRIEIGKEVIMSGCGKRVSPADGKAGRI